MGLMAADGAFPLSGDLNSFNIQSTLFAALDLNHEIQCDSSYGMKNNLVGLTRFDPSQGALIHLGVNIGFKVATGDFPSFGKGKD